MLGDGMLELGELGELGGGELLLDEQPASASAAPSSRIGMPRFNVIAGCRLMDLDKVMRSAPCRRQDARRSPQSSELKLNSGCTAHGSDPSVVSTMATCG